IGGLLVDVPQGMHDRYSGSNFTRGQHHLNGSQALAFARDRHSFLNGDLSRSANQGRLFESALDKLHTRFAKDPGVLFQWIATLWKWVHSDLPFGTLVNLAVTAATISKSAVNN